MFCSVVAGGGGNDVFSPARKAVDVRWEVVFSNKPLNAQIGQVLGRQNEYNIRARQTYGNVGAWCDFLVNKKWT